MSSTNGNDPCTKMFPIRGPSWRSNNSAALVVSKPEIVGYFSVDGERNYLPDSSQLLYYHPPRTNDVYMDLNQGIDLAVRSPISVNDERIGHLLQWIKLNHSKIQSSETGKWIQPKFVGSNGTLMKLLCNPFRPDERWIICAAKWKGTIYLCRIRSAEEIRANAKLSKNFGSWGFKFEQYILSDAPDKVPDTSRPVVEAAEFRCIFQRRFGDHVVLFSAEMDGVCSDEVLQDPLPLDKLKFVELKTHRIIQHPRQDQNFRRFKFLHWWAQTFLVGIDEVLCGFRDDSGIIRHLTRYKHEEIINLSQRFFTPAHCVDYCQSFLTRVAETVVNDCDQTIYKFERIPHGEVFMTEMSPQSEYAFLPPSFLQATL